MKKTFHIAAVILMVCCAACNNSTTEKSNIPEGLALMSKSDCSSCHNANSKVIGPSFKDIAAKYPNTPENIANLTDRVIKGSSGIWGQVPMTPHTTSQRSDVEKMVVYILSLK